MRVGINGFGRIGRQVFRILIERGIEVVAVNDLTDNEVLGHLLKYDSNYGNFPGTVITDKDNIHVNGKAIKAFSERDPGFIPWGELDVDIVVESTGIFRSMEKASEHLAGGAKYVIVSAPAKGDMPTFVMGVNEETFDPANDKVVSNASCTTNGLAPVAKVLNDAFGIEKGILTTVHSYTASQSLVDSPKDDLRDARAAAMNIVPSATGAAKAVGLVIPELKGKFSGLAFRVPTSTVSVVDFTAVLTRDASKEDINAAIKEAAEGDLKGILQYNPDPLVSMDLKGNTHSSIFSPQDTLVVGGNLAKVVSWYDNEWGYSERVADLAEYIASKI